MRARFRNRLRLFLISALCCLWVGATAQGQDNTEPLETPDWGTYPLLMSQFGELCTMCVAYLHCSAEDTSAPAADRTVLYYFETKDFWGQIQTIWDYYAQWFNPVTSESRPATVYRATTVGAVPVAEKIEAFLDKKNGTIKIDGTWIDRDTSLWYAEGSDEPMGLCRRPSIEQGLALAGEAANVPDGPGGPGP